MQCNHRGRPKVLNLSQEDLARQYFLNPTVPLVKIPSLLKISRASFFRYRQKWSPQILKVGIEDTLLTSRFAYQKAMDRLPITTAYDIQMTHYLAQSLEQRIHLVPLPFHKLPEALKQNTIDFSLGWISNSKDRKKEFQFTEEYIPAQEKQCFFFGTENSFILDSLSCPKKEITVGMQKGTIHRQFLKKMNYSDDQLKFYASEQKMLTSLSERKIDYCVSHIAPMQNFLRLGKIKICSEGFTYDCETGIMMNSNCHLLFDRISTALEEIKHRGYAEKMALNLN